MRRHVTLAIALAVSLLACRDPNGATDAASPLTPDANSGLSSGGPSTTASDVTGGVNGLTGVCPTVTFTLESKTITTSPATRYDGGACSDLKNGARVKVSGAAQANGSIAAQTIGFAVPAPVVPKEPTTASTAVKGTIKDVAGSCPVVSLKLEGKTITTTATTRYEGGVCTDMKAGVVVSVTGTVQADQSIVAQSIGIAAAVPAVPPKEPTPSTTAAVKGTASDVAGACPVLSLKLEGKKITTTSTTRYEGGVCADVKNGVVISVTGTVQADGSIVALSIGVAEAAPPVPPKEPTPSTTTAVKGTASEVAGTCPVLSLKLEGKKITTTATTRYEGGACADVKNGVVISVTGTVQADQSLVAQSIGIASPAPVPPKEPTPSTTTAVKGTASDVAGTCPVLSLKLEGKKITTTATTRYEGGVCADVKNGVVMSVTGTVQADGSILAVAISVSK